jgi:uncharacterized protein
MVLSRRRFLALTAAPLAPWVGASLGSVGAAQATTGTRPRLLSARGDGAGGYRVSGLDSGGRLVLDQPLPGRGHGLAPHPDGRHAVCVARRPGDFLLVLDLADGASSALYRTPADRHCFGHAAFSRDGHLYTTENASDSGEGRIGVWETAGGYRRLGELPSHGIDPHEVLLAPDGETLIVANGGILTRPETGRAKLNLDTMQPSLVYLDRRDGRLLADYRLAPQRHQLSIRHLALGRDGTVCVALQYEGPATDLPPLVTFQRPGQGIELVHAPAEVQAAMRNYCGSVAADPSGDWFAVSAPRGNLITFWGLDGRFQGSTQVADGCGVAPGDASGTFFISSGTGTLHRHDCMTGETAWLPGLSNEGIEWDNHLALCA